MALLHPFLGLQELPAVRRHLGAPVRPERLVPRVVQGRLHLLANVRRLRQVAPHRPGRRQPHLLDGILEHLLQAGPLALAELQERGRRGPHPRFHVHRSRHRQLLHPGVGPPRLHDVQQGRLPVRVHLLGIHLQQRLDRGLLPVEGGLHGAGPLPLRPVHLLAIPLVDPLDRPVHRLVRCGTCCRRSEFPPPSSSADPECGTRGRAADRCPCRPCSSCGTPRTGCPCCRTCGSCAAPRR